MQAAPTPLHPAFDELVGSWKGSNKVYFGPNQPPVDTAEIVGEIRLVSGGRLLEFSYTSTFKGKSIDGKLLISYDGKLKEYLMTWVDSYHNNNRILQLTSGRDAEIDTISAFGEYPANETVNWGWRIDVLPKVPCEARGPSQLCKKCDALNLTECGGGNGLEILHYNVPPGEEGVLGIDWALELVQ